MYVNSQQTYLETEQNKSNVQRIDLCIEVI